MYVIVKLYFAIVMGKGSITEENTIVGKQRQTRYIYSASNNRRKMLLVPKDWELGLLSNDVYKDCLEGYSNQNLPLFYSFNSKPNFDLDILNFQSKYD